MQGLPRPPSACDPPTVTFRLLVAVRPVTSVLTALRWVHTVLGSLSSSFRFGSFRSVLLRET